MFFNSLGGAISISIAQNVFTNTLIGSVPKHTTGVDPYLVSSSGATQLRGIVPADQLQGVLVAYTYAICKAFILPIAVAGMAFIVSLFVSIFVIYLDQYCAENNICRWNGILSRERKLCTVLLHSFGLLIDLFFVG